MTLFTVLRRHAKLAEKRNPMFEKNRFAKFWMYLMGIFWLCYFVFIGVIFAKAFDGESREPYHILNAGLIFVFAIDFLMRFAFQKLPTQEVKPYLLMPVKRRRLIDFLLTRSGLHGFNILWLFLFVPFALLTVWKYYGLWGVCTYSIGIWLLTVLNNYWYLFCRTLLNERFWWIVLPLAFYGAVALLIFLPEKSEFFTWSMQLGEGFITGNPLTFAGVLAVIVLLWCINRALMSHLIYSELAKTEDTKVKHLSEYKFLDRYGEMGEYMRLELKMLLRNKLPKASFNMAVVFVLFFSLMLSFSSIYDTNFMRSFIVIYNFAVFGLMFLTAVMSYEGNYIDALMSRKESIYTLLRAKYTLYSLAVLIPLVLMIPTIVMGKLSLVVCLGWALFSIGPIYCGLFQMAVYNNKCVALNDKVTARRNMNTGWQGLVSGLTFALPLLLSYVMNALLGEILTAWILLVIGAGFVLTSNFWLRNIYRRFMKRRYRNMEGFHNSRQE
ncbi:MAG: DUF5687 family protein [Prevotellaceae bacterium]|nr:DUF5687 family protein [Prevotellaceae bacterium]